MNEPTLIHQSPIPSLSNLSNCQLWMSMQFSTTPLHYDKCNGLLIQLKGKKRFIIFSIHQAQDLYLNNIGPLQGSRLMNLNEYYGKPYPQAWEVDKPIMESEKKEFMERVFVRFKGLIPIVYDLDEGDVLYTPAGWMHEVIIEIISYIHTYYNFDDIYLIMIGISWNISFFCYCCVGNKCD